MCAPGRFLPSPGKQGNATFGTPIEDHGRTPSRMNAREGSGPGSGSAARHQEGRGNDIAVGNHYELREVGGKLVHQQLVGEVGPEMRRFAAPIRVTLQPHPFRLHPDEPEIAARRAQGAGASAFPLLELA